VFNNVNEMLQYITKLAVSLSSQSDHCSDQLHCSYVVFVCDIRYVSRFHWDDPLSLNDMLTLVLRCCSPLSPRNSSWRWQRATTTSPSSSTSRHRRTATARRRWSRASSRRNARISSVSRLAADQSCPFVFVIHNLCSFCHWYWSRSHTYLLHYCNISCRSCHNVATVRHPLLTDVLSL